MSASCDSLLRVSTAFKLGLLTFRSANVKGTACLQDHEVVSQEGHMAISTDASGLLACRGPSQDQSCSLTGVRQHDTMHYSSASSHFLVAVGLSLFHTMQSLKLSALHAEGSHSNQWLT